MKFHRNFIVDETRTVICCQYCHYICHDRNVMMQHHRRRHAAKQIAILEFDRERTSYICSHSGCGKSYTQRKRLNEHRQSHYRRFKCTVNGCGQSFWRRFDLKQHLRTKHGGNNQENLEECPFCGKRFVSNGTLRKHIEYAHSGNNIKAFTCRKCQKGFNSKCGLERHWITHENDSCGEGKWFQCKYCGLSGKNETKRFRFRYNLNKHIRKYHGKELSVTKESR